MHKNIKIIIWLAVGLLGLFALSTIALNRGESINALWLITAAVCIYAKRPSRPTANQMIILMFLCIAIA